MGSTVAYTGRRRGCRLHDVCTRGMGTHHVMLNNFSMDDPGFDVDDPYFPDTRIDGIFDHQRPEFLMCRGEERGSSWSASHGRRGSNRLPPEGFSGGNDWWHRHHQCASEPASPDYGRGPE